MPHSTMPSIGAANLGFWMMHQSVHVRSYLTALNEFYTLHRKIQFSS
jgi:hypothetical protein